MLTVKRSSISSSVLILLAPEFKEGSLVYCLERLREAGISVSLVGLTSRLIKGYHGMTVRPDATFGQLPESLNHRMILLPDGKKCVSVLFADPRVYQLLQSTLSNRGVVAAMPEAEALLEAAGLVTSETAAAFVWHKGSGLEAFAEQMIDHLQTAY